MKITSGRIKRPHLVLIYGVDGAGKSTWASTFPSPIFIGPENGSDNLDVSRAEEIDSYKKMLDSLEWLKNNKHDFKTVVIDSVDWVEPLLYKSLCERYKVDEIESIAGGYGRHVNVMLVEWKVFIEKVNVLRATMNIVLISHYHIRAFNDPSSNEPYDRYMIKLQEKTSSLFREWVDCVLFLNFETFTKKDKGVLKAKAFSDGERYLYTTKTAAYDAKNRFGLPPKMKLQTFLEYELAINGASVTDIELIKAEINDLMLDVKDAELLEKIKASMVNADFNKLTAIKGRIMEIV
jgi:hypothetical protein